MDPGLRRDDKKRDIRFFLKRAIFFKCLWERRLAAIGFCNRHKTKIHGETPLPLKAFTQ
jgi:hypothetical protein